MVSWQADDPVRVNGRPTKSQAEYKQKVNRNQTETRHEVGGWDITDDARQEIMAYSTKRRRWRDTRDTMPARRRRRRARRRDQKCSRNYSPMVVDSQIALRGVRARLLGALVAVVVTLVCGIYMIVSAMSSFGATFALAVGLCSFGAAVALLLSARQEEKVHAFAARMEGGGGPRGCDGPSKADTRRSTPRALAKGETSSLLGRDERTTRSPAYRAASGRRHASVGEARLLASADKTDGAI